MSYNQPAPEGKDPELWQIARKRASFKSHLVTYLIINAFLWALWFFTSNGMHYSFTGSNIPWPAWTTLGWGIGLAFHYAGAYINPRSNSVENEYEKLKNNKQ